MIKTVKSRSFLMLIMILSAVSHLAAADQQDTATIVWMDNAEEVVILGSGGSRIRSEIGGRLTKGFTIRTGESTVELELIPNGSVIVINENTIFRIDSLEEKNENNGTRENTFSLLKGKLRFIAAKVTGSLYSVRTQSAVAGVRGTDFYRMYDPAGGKDWLCVTEGAVQFESPDGAEGVLVPAGNFVNLNKGFITAEPDQQWLENNLNLETLQKAVLPPS